MSDMRLAYVCSNCDRADCDNPCCRESPARCDARAVSGLRCHYRAGHGGLHWAQSDGYGSVHEWSGMPPRRREDPWDELLGEAGRELSPCTLFREEVVRAAFRRHCEGTDEASALDGCRIEVLSSVDEIVVMRLADPDHRRAAYTVPARVVVEVDRERSNVGECADLRRQTSEWMDRALAAERERDRCLLSATAARIGELASERDGIAIERDSYREAARELRRQLDERLDERLTPMPDGVPPARCESIEPGPARRLRCHLIAGHADLHCHMTAAGNREQWWDYRLHDVAAPTTKFLTPAVGSESLGEFDRAAPSPPPMIAGDRNFACVKCKAPADECRCSLPSAHVPLFCTACRREDCEGDICCEHRPGAVASAPGVRASRVIPCQSSWDPDDR